MTDDELRDRALAGDEAEKFVVSGLGRAMIQIANEDADAAVLAFSQADPNDLKVVAKIQQDLRVAMSFERYLAELVQRGREAVISYQQRQQES